MHIEDDERGLIQVLDENRSVHATFTYTRGLPSTRGSAKLQANAWLQGYRYAKLPVAPSAPLEVHGSTVLGMPVVVDPSMGPNEMAVVSGRVHVRRPQGR